MLTHKHLVDAGTIHIDNLKVETLPTERLARFGNMLEQLKNQPAEGIVVIVGIEVGHVKVFEEVIERILPVHEPSVTSGTFSDFRFFVDVG